MSKEFLNEIGINGTGKGFVNTNANDFKALKKAIEESYAKQTPQERLDNRLFALHLKMRDCLSKEYQGESKSVGHFLREHLEALYVTHRAFAQFLEIKESNLSAILASKRRISIDLAYKLGQIFEADASLWLQVQNKEELRKVAKQSGKAYRLDDLLGRVG